MDEGATDTFPPPGPGSGPFMVTLSVFIGTDPNGVWSLYVVDDLPDDSGQIAGGWSLAITTSVPHTYLQTCLYAGSLSQVSALPEGETAPTVTCGRGKAILVTQGIDYYACLYAGSLSQVGTSEPASCGRGEVVGLAAGDTYAACLFAGSLSRVGTSEPTCGRGAVIGLDGLLLT